MSAARQPEYRIDPQFTERWSPRAFTGEALDFGTLLTILEAARWAPSGSNLQPWRFIYGLRGTPAFEPLLATLAESNRVWARQAGALVLVLSRTQRVVPGKEEPQPITSHAFDAGAAWMSLALQAQALGWHAHAMGGFDRAVARESLGIPADHALHAVVALGRRGEASLLPPALQEREQPNARLPLAALVAEGKFGFEG
ncbi:nitroreductase family protein [Azohydromonas caseinilytica]|uniref:Nitroreductase family protein n=1 Tax=Azohydromonas caseinilytica TaxID=2728836 RepID=A0A848FBR7_9BURK|nr:nitroreductase family protein [Azohydromonas caseinilytica]NML16356.1 nitroreductase family protein [Azohydromonas caseinilytica]